MRKGALVQLLHSGHFQQPALRERPLPGWHLDELRGRLVELTGWGASAVLTLASALVGEAQHAGEPVAWITGSALVYPPDLAENGIDLEALVFVRVTATQQALVAADRLLRSGAFGLLVLEIGALPQLALAAQTRLLGLAQQHDSALLCLTRKRPSAGSLGSLISLHGHVARQALGGGRFSCTLEVLKDKRNGPGWCYQEICRGPIGLR